MSLSHDIISQFVKITNDNKKETKKETVTYGIVSKVEDGNAYVILDGVIPDANGEKSAIPVSKTVNVAKDDRVIVMIKNHSAVITGNLGNPAVNTGDVVEIKTTVTNAANTADDTAKKVVEFEIALGKKLDTEEFTAKVAAIENLETDSLLSRTVKANEGNIQDLTTNKLSASDAEIIYAKISELDATNIRVKALEASSGSFEQVNAILADIETLKSDKLDAKTAEIQYAKVAELDGKYAKITDLETTYANIDFSNIGEAAIRKIFADTGIIENIVVSEGTITGKLVGVTITGDLIEGGTVIADKLVVKGEDGLYYKLNTDGVTTEAEQTDYNSLNGSIIKAKSITATKISVDDLVAFDATIGGFNVTTESLYSGTKESVDNSTQGVYMDREGQIALGDADNYLKYYRDENGNWKLEISAESILFGSDSKSSASDIKALTEHVKIGTYTDPETNETQPCVELSEGDSNFKQVITNTKTVFMDGNTEHTSIDTNGISSTKITAKEESGVGKFVWKERSNGNLGLIWKGGSN